MKYKTGNITQKNKKSGGRQMNISYYKDLFREELLKSCVPFWLEHGIDREYGGILNCLDREGEVYSEDKSVWMQGRAGWMFSYIYNRIEKKQEYLNDGKRRMEKSRWMLSVIIPFLVVFMAEALYLFVWTGWLENFFTK
jgi:hypothetical protein